MTNILLITLDCLRPDHLSAYGYKKETAPFLSKFLEENQHKIFKNCFSTGPFTPASFPGILGSLYPLDAENYSPLPEEVITIPQVLKENKYFTFALQGANPQVSSYMGYAKGFDHFEDYIGQAKIYNRRKSLKKRIMRKSAEFIKVRANRNRLGKHFWKAYYNMKLKRFSSKNKQPSVPYTPAHKIAEDFKKLDLTEPFFGWLHFMDIHKPYWPLEKFRKELNCEISNSEMLKLYELMKWHNHRDNESVRRIMNVEEIEKIKELYDATIRQVDHSLGEIFEHLKQKGILDNTIIIITADHGEEFNEHGRLSHVNSTYDELIHLPFIVINSNLDYPEDGMISTIDLAPTICGMLSLEIPKSFRGKDLTKNKRDSIVAESRQDSQFRYIGPYKNYGKEIHNIVCVRTMNHKVIVESWGENKKEMFFDLKADPQEQNPSEEVPIEFQAMLEEHKSSRRIVENKLDSFDENEVIASKLKSLGYMD